MLKINLSTDQVLGDLKFIITQIRERKPSERYDNTKDIQEFPYQINCVVINDKNNFNNGHTFSIKLKDKTNIQVGQTIDFEKTMLKDGSANLWANQNRFVQVSLKGDALIERK